MLIVLLIFTSLNMSKAVNISDYNTFEPEDFKWWIIKDIDEGLPEDNDLYDLIWNYYDGTNWNEFNPPWVANSTSHLRGVELPPSYHPDFGWHLIHFEFGYSKNSNNNTAFLKSRANPWFCLYNQYTGVLRFFYYMATPPSNGFNGAMLTLTFDDKPGDYTTANLYQGGGFSEYQGSDDVNWSTTNSVSSVVHGDDLNAIDQWVYFDFDMNYDYDLDRVANGTSIKAQFQYITSSQVDLTTDETTQTYTSVLSEFDPNAHSYVFGHHVGHDYEVGEHSHDVHSFGHTLHQGEELLEELEEVRHSYHYFLETFGSDHSAASSGHNGHAGNGTNSDLAHSALDVFEVVGQTLAAVHGIYTIGGVLGVWELYEEKPEATLSKSVSHGEIDGTILTETVGSNDYIRLPGTFEGADINQSQQSYYNSPLGLVTLEESPTIQKKRFNYKFERRIDDVHDWLNYIEVDNLPYASFGFDNSTNVDLQMNGCMGVENDGVKFALVAVLPPKISIPWFHSWQHVNYFSDDVSQLNGTIAENDGFPKFDVERKQWNLLADEYDINPFYVIDIARDEDDMPPLTMSVKNPMMSAIELGHLHVSGFDPLTGAVEVTTMYVDAEDVGSLTLNIPNQYYSVKLRMAAKTSGDVERLIFRDFALDINEHTGLTQELHRLKPEYDWDYHFLGGHWDLSSNNQNFHQNLDFPYQSSEDKPDLFEDHMLVSNSVVTGTSQYVAGNSVTIVPNNNGVVLFAPGSSVYVGVSLDLQQSFNSNNDIYSFQFSSSSSCEMANDNYYKIGSETEMSHVRSDFDVFPNPAMKGGTVYFEDDIQSAQLFDLSGALISEFKGDDERLDVSNLNSGVYIIRGMTDEGSKSTKLIIQ